MLSRLLYSVRQQGNVSSTLDCYSQSSLMLCTVSGDTARKDLTSLGYVSLQLVNILVIDTCVLFAAEYTYFLSSTNAAGSSLSRCIAAIFIECHLKNLLSKFLVKRETFVIYSIGNIHETVRNRTAGSRSGLRLIALSAVSLTTLIAIALICKAIVSG